MARRDIPEQREGAIEGTGDAGFHAPLLGDDRLPEDVLERIRALAVRLGLDPRIVDH